MGCQDETQTLEKLTRLVEKMGQLQQKIQDIGQPISESELEQLRALGRQYAALTDQLARDKDNKNH